MLDHILIKKFTNGLNNELTRERVILKAFNLSPKLRSTLGVKSRHVELRAPTS